jgi:hypothetical protein
MARTKRVVVDAAVKTDGQHGTYVKSTRAPQYQPHFDHLASGCLRALDRPGSS